MSTVLDGESVVLEAPRDALACLFLRCEAAATWQWLMTCACVWRYCDEHDAEMFADRDMLGCYQHGKPRSEARVRIVLRTAL